MKQLDIFDTLAFIGLVLLLVLIGVFYSQTHAIGAEYAVPNREAYFASLKQPDHPKTSCCGEADGYYADKTDACDVKYGIQENPNWCSLVVIITDTRPDDLPIFGDNPRYHVPVGTRIVIPKHKRRKHAIPNPTGHNIVFLAVGWGMDWEDTKPGDLDYNVWCYEPGGALY